MTKGFSFLRGSHVDATWHSGPRGSATRAHVTPTGRIIIFIIHIVHSFYKWVFSLPYIGRVFEPYKPSGVINPTISFILFRVGLIHTKLFDAGDVAAHDALDRAGRGTRCVDRVDAWSTGDDQVQVT